MFCQGPIHTIFLHWNMCARIYIHTRKHTPSTWRVATASHKRGSRNGVMRHNDYSRRIRNDGTEIRVT